MFNFVNRVKQTKRGGKLLIKQIDIFAVCHVMSDNTKRNDINVCSERIEPVVRNISEWTYQLNFTTTFVYFSTRVVKNVGNCLQILKPD